MLIVFYIVTEYTFANLRGKGTNERAGIKLALLGQIVLNN